MVIKLVFHILVIAVVVCFFGFNFETKVDIKFWFGDNLTLKEVSLFTSLAVAYLLGIITFLPSYIKKSFSSKKNKPIKVKNKKVKADKTVVQDSTENQDNE